MTLEELAQHWWLLLIRGLIGVLFGIAALAWPGLTLILLISFFGAYMFVDGVIALIAAVRFRRDGRQAVLLAIEGVLGLAVGTVTFIYPVLAALAWVYVIAAWAIVTGALEIAGAVSVRRGLGAELLLLFSGIVSIALGVGFAILPYIGIVAAVLMIGVYAIVFGALLIATAVRLRTAFPGHGQTTPGGVS